MFRICVWVPKKMKKEDTGDTVVVDALEELCMPVGPVIPLGGYIDPIDIVTHPEPWSLTLDGKELTISSDLRELSTISSVASRIQDKRIRDVIHEGLRAA